ncbi:MAG: hypothetical protein GY862_37600, partial [Gammaproteobacteria bacterium]|nr:hypothetical protein [Gammaproteobacteria bacterium]
TRISADAPVIEKVSPPQAIENSNTASIWAEVSDDAGIARVWAVVRTPDDLQNIQTDDSVHEIPSFELNFVEGNRYTGSYDSFDKEINYTIAVYARDRDGNTSLPKVTAVSVKNPFLRKAVIIAGASLSGNRDEDLNHVYNVFKNRNYDDDAIYYLSNVSAPGVDVLSTLDNVKFALGTWAQSGNTKDITIYLTGAGNENAMKLNDTEALLFHDLDTWLDELQENIAATVTLIYEGAHSDSFVRTLMPPPDKDRIVIKSSGGNNPNCRYRKSSTLSFSRFFWQNVQNGDSVWQAFSHAGKTAGFAYGGLAPLLDDNGNGVANETASIDGRLPDKYFARDRFIGTGILVADEKPRITAVSPEQFLSGETGAILWAEAAGEVESVWAEITPPGHGCYSSLEQCGADPLSIALAAAADGRYEAVYHDFVSDGSFKIAIYARDGQGHVSSPGITYVHQGKPGACLHPSQTAYRDGNTLQVTAPPAPPGYRQHLGVGLPDGRLFVIDKLNSLTPFEHYADITALPSQTGGIVANIAVDENIPRGEYRLYLMRRPEAGFTVFSNNWTLGESFFFVE